MCGIAGIVTPDLDPLVRAEAVERMCAAMVHRGPDDVGQASVDTATLGMRRLAIFDPANGRQPFVSPEGRYTLVFNGAIYNFRALRAELASSWTFRTDCDTEVLLAAYARWGHDCLPRLRGMFAFAVWDRDSRSLFFARDPFGIKPLYYWTDNSRLVLASELNALFASGHVPRSVDPRAVQAFLAWQAIPAPQTLFHGVRSLRPGEAAHFRDGKLTVSVWWRFPSTTENIGASSPVCRDTSDFTRALRAQLDDTIAAHCVADVPVGAFLSGGLDSAVVAGLMARQVSGGLKTFSIGFDEAAFSEADAAAATARHLGTRHHTTILRAHDVVADIDRIVAGLDHPTGDGINTYYVSRAARAGGVTVALSGLGGDELFGGYPSFRHVPRLSGWLAAWRLLPAALRRSLTAPLVLAGVRGEKLADVIAGADDVPALALLQRRVLSDHHCRRLLLNRAPTDAHPQLPALRAEVDSRDLFAVASGAELRGYMADLLLRDSDAMSMAHSLELRVPFVDRPLIEWLWRQPSRFKSTPARPKSALATAARDVLPPDIFDRRKRGFTFPFALWMRGELQPWVRDTLAPAAVARTGLLDPAAVEALCAPFFAGRDDHAWSRVWSLAILVAYLQRPSAARVAAAA